MARALTLLLFVLAEGVIQDSEDVESKKKHHHSHHDHHHHGHHGHHRGHGHHRAHDMVHVVNSSGEVAAPADLHQQETQKVVAPHSAAPSSVTADPKLTHSGASDQLIVSKMREIEKELTNRKLSDLAVQKGHLKVNAPLPVNFNQLFSSGVAEATGCREADVKVVSSQLLARGNVGEVFFEGPHFAVVATEEQASDPDSKLARGPLRLLLTAREDHPSEEDATEAAAPPPKEPEVETSADAEPPSHSLDANLEMPYGELEPFGREDTAQELTQASIEESDRMVDQLERAEVAEEKRAIFRALTRLRGAAITSFDGVARAQTGVIDEYNKAHKWRGNHPVQHLANEESDISKWAFPDF